MSTGELPLYGQLARDIARDLARKMPTDVDAMALSKELEWYADKFASWQSALKRPPTAERNVMAGKFMTVHRAALEKLKEASQGKR